MNVKMMRAWENDWWKKTEKRKPEESVMRDRERAVHNEIEMMS